MKAYTDMTGSSPFPYFLRAYDSSDPVERKRLSSIVWVELGLFLMFVSITIIHLVFGMHVIHFLGDVGGALCILLSLWVFQRGRLTLAGVYRDLEPGVGHF